MAKFLKLHRIQDKEPVYVNIDKICGMEDLGGFTSIIMTNGCECKVSDTPEEILKLADDVIYLCTGEHTSDEWL